MRPLCHANLSVLKCARLIFGLLTWGWLAARCHSVLAHELSPVSEYQVTVWRVEDGLPQSTVTSIAQTADGYLWLGTQNGLVRFDGVKFRVYDENNTAAIKNSRIVRVSGAPDGTLWVGTEHSGLVAVNAGKFTAHAVPSHGTTHDYARVFASDRENALWEVSCEWQLIKFLGGQFSVVSDGWNLASRVPRALACDREGRMWVGTESELAVQAQGRFRPVWGTNNEPNFQVDFLAPGRAGGVWVAANGRLRKFEAGQWTKDLGLYDWMNRPIYDLYEDRENRLWVATLGSGLFRYGADGVILHLTTQNGLPTDFIRCVTEDEEGNIWVGTEGGGICRLKQSIFKTYGVKQGLASDQVMSMAKGQNGGVWISTDGDGLDFWNEDVIRHYGFKEGLNNGHVWSVIQDRHGTVWAGTWDGIFHTQADGKFVDISDGQTVGWQVLAIYENKKGDIWLGQQAFGGITRLRGEERTVVKIPGTSENLDVRAIVEDAAGNLWIGTSEEGLYQLKDGKFYHYGRDEGLGGSAIWALHLDEQGVLWVGTCRGGLSRFQDGRFVTWTTKNGLVNDVICQILEDGRGNLWLGSYGGIFRVSKKELNESLLLPGSIGRQVHCMSYNLEDGLPSLECQGGFQPSGYKSADGRLWFPTIKGLVMVDPERIGTNSLPPRVVVENVIADGAPNSELLASAATGVDGPGPITIPPGNQRIEIQYTALSFSAPNRVRFKYRLRGLEKNWEDGGAKRAAVYSHVPPGHYQFQVIACNGDGIWNETGAGVAMTVVPYFWETTWFLILNVIVGLALVVSIVRFAERRRMRSRLQKAERERAVERERARIAKDIHDDLGANLTEIALLSEFAQQPTASARQVQADMQKITVKARNLTQIMDEVVWAVNPTNDTLEKFVTYTCSFVEEYLQTVKIACRLEIPEVLPEITVTSEVRHNLFLVVKEALNNIAKHSGAQEVNFQVELAEDALILVLRDDGCGFQKTAALSSIANGSQKDGLANMRKRMEGISGTIEVESQPGQGTRIKLLVSLFHPATHAGLESPR